MSLRIFLFRLAALILPLACTAQSTNLTLDYPSGTWYTVTVADLETGFVPGGDFRSPTFTVPATANQYRLNVKVPKDASWRIDVRRTVTPPWDLNIPLELSRRDIINYMTVTGVDQQFLTGTNDLGWTELIIQVSLAARYLVPGTLSTTLTFTLTVL
jgi:hypothetical protein